MPGKFKTLADAGEFEFIKTIRNMMPKEGGNIVRSIGDDCLVIESFKDNLLLGTTDTFVEGIHFKLEYSTFPQIGQRCMAASVSDIAAMSGNPVYSLVSLSMPGDMQYNNAIDLFSGLQNTAKLYGCPIVGGETTSTTGPVTITVTVLGKIERDRMILRSGAGAGDSIYVTGSIGDAMAGLMAIERKAKGFNRIKSKFQSPEAFVTLSRALNKLYNITAMIDTSDGLATDLSNICHESVCGAEIYEDMLPFSDEFRRFSKKYGIDMTDLGISSGEEFELLFTSNDVTISEKFQLMNHNITHIGKIVESSHGIKLYRKNKNVEPVLSKGYEHFKS